jgi:hypothetical protein
MTQTTTTLHCANHPDVETTLRCKRCDKPICPKCAVYTETGYICKECRRNQQKLFDSAKTIDYPVAIIVAGVLSFLGSLIASRISFLIIFVAPIIGGLIAEAVRALIQRRRSKNLFLLTAAAVAAGSLPQLLIPLSGILLGGGVYLFGLIWQVLYTILVTSTVYYRLAGIQMR